MHLFITLTSYDNLELPIQYNHLLQGVIYEVMDPELSAFLHDKGYQSGNRRFKLFTFSRIKGSFNVNKEKGTLQFSGGLSLTVSSPVIDFCQSIANGLLTRGEIRLGNSRAVVRSIAVEQFTAEDEQIILKTLSPVVTYSTLLRPDGRKYTCYFQPGDPDYDSLIENNLRKKYQAFYGQEASDGAVKVKKLGTIKMNIINYKGTIIKGYSGRLKLTGPRELLQMAVDAGVGSKNGQGFGCVEVE